LDLAHIAWETPSIEWVAGLSPITHAAGLIVHHAIVLDFIEPVDPSNFLSRAGLNPVMALALDEICKLTPSLQRRSMAYGQATHVALLKT
jgi:hypothetical protein